MYKITANNGRMIETDNLKSARKIASQFYRVSKNQRYGYKLNFFAPAAIEKNGKIIFSIDNAGNEKFYKWNM